MKAKRYSREEWEAAKSLKKCGKTWAEVATALGRNGTHIGKAIKRFDNYDSYLESFRRLPGRRTEQLQFLPPELPVAPKKIQVRSIEVKPYRKLTPEKLEGEKMRMATRMAQITKRYIEELRDAGFRF